MNNFYKQPNELIWIESLVLLMAGFLPALLIIEKGYSQPILYFSFIIYVPISQFAFTPFFKIIGVYKYYSPMLLGYMSNDKQIDLHSGTSFDYLFVMKKYKSGIELRNRLLLYHLEGLIKLIELIENKTIPESVSIIGTSYFFNNRTLNKLGFDVVNPTLFYRVNLFLNFIDLIWMYSLSKGIFSIPKLWDARKACISGNKLIERKKEFEFLYAKMQVKLNSPSN